jgi:hypothetical protein
MMLPKFDVSDWKLPPISKMNVSGLYFCAFCKMKIQKELFPSLLKDDKVPIRASTFVQDHLWPAPLSAGALLGRGSASVFTTCGTA